MKKASQFAYILFAAFLLQAADSHANKCSIAYKRFTKVRKEVETFKFDMPDLEVGSVSDSTLATGVTLFNFPNEKATASFDARGGSVAAIETELLSEGSYSNNIDGILFAGGSTMGLEATQGVRRRIFAKRSQNAGDFDFIPSIPGAVVYDYGGRVESRQDALVFPSLTLGAAAYDRAESGKMLIGRVGAGTTTTANKISERPIWGGQGAAFKEITLDNGFSFKVFTAVILNSHGNITLPPDTKIDAKFLSKLQRQSKSLVGVKKNTTLSIVVTDVALDRNQLKRLATMVHTSMASVIHPFHSYTDGDILFSVSLNTKEIKGMDPMLLEESLQIESSALMKQAIIKSVTVSNKLGAP